MSIVLCRVDERLIHGQVVLGWGGHLQPQHYVVVDDEIAKAEWEQELYRLALPASGGATVEFISPKTASVRCPELARSDTRTVVLTRDLETMLKLVSSGALSDTAVNLGGLHYAPDRREVVPYLHLDEADVERIRWLDQAGVAVEARDLPSAPALSAEVLIRKGRLLWSG